MASAPMRDPDIPTHSARHETTGSSSGWVRPRGYRFTDDWYVSADPEAVRTLLRNVSDWPSWWPSSLSVLPAQPRVEGATEASLYTFQTRLPYRLVFQADVTGESDMAVDVEVVGRVHGTGSWSVAATPGGARVHFDWSVDPREPWMRIVSPLARPVFIWNHRSLMAEGARAFARRLGADLLREPACTPSVRGAVLELGAWLTLVGALLVIANNVVSAPGSSERGA